MGLIYIWISIHGMPHNGNFVDGKSGYMFTKDDVFSIDKKLNSASLSDVPLTYTIRIQVKRKL